MKTKATISAKLEYRGKKYNKKGFLSRFSTGTYVIDERKSDNSCLDICEDNILDEGYWSVALELDTDYMLEIRFKYDFDHNTLTFETLYSLVWLMDGGILDEVQPIIKVTER